MLSLFHRIISPFWQAALFLVLLPILELFLLLTFFGQWLTLLSMFIGGVFGVYLAHREGIKHWIELNKCLDNGGSPTMPTINILLVIVGVLFMILPGLLTCLFGLCLLVRLPRFLVATHIVLQFESYRLHTRRGNVSTSPEIIDV